MSSREAASLLDVKRETLYAYASRGLVRSIPSGAGRGRRYNLSDLDRLKARHDARSGHGPVAASALRWGEPVLETLVSGIDERGPIYRGHHAVTLAEDGVGFEATSELLWSGRDPTPRRWKPGSVASEVTTLARVIPTGRPPIPTLTLATTLALAGESDTPRPTRGVKLSRSRHLIRLMAGTLGLAGGTRAAIRAAEANTIAEAAALALGRPDGGAVAAIDLALVLCADHELNASTFAARIAASTGASLHGCVVAALAVLGGHRHGTASDRVEALLDEIREPERAAAVVRRRLDRGASIPGFGHPLYARGDPRVLPLVAAATRVATEDALAVPLALEHAARGARLDAPNLDFGIAVLVRAFGLPRGSGAALFALGRTAGWVAHVLEQRESGYLLRPRARYRGPRADG